MERATWWGGFWERLVRKIKVLEKASLNFEEMTTILTEVEAGLHSRPLSYIHNAHKPQPLTPLHFFVGKKTNLFATQNYGLRVYFLKSDQRTCCLPMEVLTETLPTFWNSWHEDYLLDLKSAHKSDSIKATMLKEGDVVLIG